MPHISRRSVVTGTLKSALWLGVAPILLANCALIKGGTKGLDPTCPEMESGDFSQFKIQNAPVVDADVKAFLDASYTFGKITSDLETSLVTSCASIGKDIGVDPAVLDLKADGGASAVKVCGAVAAKIEDIRKANPGVTLALDVGAATCEANVTVGAACLGPVDCGVKGLAATKCTVPVNVTVTGSGNADLQALVTSLQTNLPAILAMQVGTAPKLVAAGVGVTKTGIALKSDLGPKIGIHGCACLISAVAKATGAGASIESNVNAGASISVSLNDSPGATVGATAAMAP